MQLSRKQTFTGWVNHQLSRKKYPPIADVRKDLIDGVNLIRLVEALWNQKFPKYNKEPSTIHHKIENVGLAIDVMKERQGKKFQITPEGKKKKKPARI